MRTTPQRGKSLWKRRRLWLALIVSVALHLLLLPELSLTPEEQRPRVILATLTTDTPERADNNDQRGDLSTDSNPLSGTAQPPEPEKPFAADAPATPETAEAPEPITAASAPEKIPTYSEPKTPPKQAVDTANQKTRNNTTSVSTPRTTSAKQSTTDAPLASFQGQDQRFSDPEEQQYYEQLMAHLSNKLPAHPEGIRGTVRLQIVINYGAVITSVDVIQSSGDPTTDEWSRRAVLSVSPVPTVPARLSQPYYFRPTIRLTD